jgi:hypothetical protein
VVFQYYPFGLDRYDPAGVNECVGCFHPPRLMKPRLLHKRSGSVAGLLCGDRFGHTVDFASSLNTRNMESAKP